MATTRIVWNQITASGRRTSWARTFTGVAAGIKGAKAFTGGEYLPDGEEVDLEPGTLVVEVIPTGSVKNGSQQARFYRVGVDGLEPVGDSFDWFKAQLSAQDYARKLLAEPVSAPEPENPLAGFSDLALLEELRRRDIAFWSPATGGRAPGYEGPSMDGRWMFKVLGPEPAEVE